MSHRENHLSPDPVPDSPPPTGFRFVASGGPVDRVRAALASPLLVGGAMMISLMSGMPTMAHRMERLVGRAAERLAGVQLEVEGLENVVAGERYVVVALHEGFADALALLRLPLDLSFAARDELFEWPSLGRVLRSGGHVRVDTISTVASTKRLLRDARATLAQGDSLVLFAQGSILGIEAAFQPGAKRLARALGYPILPVVLAGAHQVWEHPYSATFRTSQRISMRVLAAIPSSEMDNERFRGLEREMKRTALSEAFAPVRSFEPDRDGWWDGYPYLIDPDFVELAERVRIHRVRQARVQGGSERT